MENELTLAGGVTAGIWFLNITAVWLLSIGSYILNFWIRDKKFNSGDYIQKLKWGWLKEDSPWPYKGDFMDWLLLFFVVEGLLGILIVRAVDKLALHGFLYPVLFVVVLLLVVLYLPRFVVDITKGLKMNHRTGNLDKINDLQKQIDALKGKGE